MSLRGIILAPCLLLAITMVSAAKPSDPLNPSAKEVAAATAWFDALHWPGLHQAPYVELTFARTPDEGDAERLKVRAFLLGEDEDTVTVFCDGTSVLRGGNVEMESRLPYTVQHFSKTAREDGENLQLPYRKLDLRTAVDELLAGHHHPPGKTERASLETRQVQADRTAVFVLARCCAQNGQPDLAERLDRELLQPAHPSVETSGYPSSQRFLATVEDSIANNVYWQTIGSYGDLNVSRAQLLPMFEWMARAFPQSTTHQWAAEVAARLKPMVAEDEAHARTAKPLAAMTRDEKIAELIFELRDQNGSQRMRPGWCDIFDTSVKDSPAEQLQKLALKAVPALIGALEDQRLSRSVGASQSCHAPTNPIWPVGDCAVEILNRIAGRDFWGASGEGIDTSAPPHQNADEARQAYAQQRTAALYRVIKAWWQDVQSRGLKAVLVEGVRRGRRDSVDQAELLAELDPTAAPGAIDDGIRAAGTADDGTDSVDWTRTRLLEIMAGIKTTGITPALRRQMREGPTLHVRLAAAQALFTRGETGEAVTAMIGEWQRWQPLPQKSVFDDANNPGPLIVFLGTCGNLDAMRALADRFASLPTDDKFKVLESVTDSWEAMPNARDEETPPPEVAAFGEQMAVTALTDRTVRYGLSGSGGDGSYRDPRVCDMAAYHLSKQWPERYAFQWLPTRQERERFIVQDLNTWRTAHGQTPLPTPERPAQPKADQQPNVVSTCDWKGGDALADPPVKPGEVLTVRQFDLLVSRLHRELPGGCVGFGLAVERPGDRRGVAIEIEWLHGARPEPIKGWNFGLSIARGEKSLYGAGGGESYPLPDEKPRSRPPVLSHADEGSAVDDDQRAALVKALASDVGQTIAIYYHSELRGE